MRLSDRDWLEMLVKVTRKILGEPISGSGDSFRWGKRGKLSVDSSKGWYDHRDKVGGKSPIKLVAHLTDLTEHDALNWLKSNHFLNGPASHLPRLPVQHKPPTKKPFDVGMRPKGEKLYANAKPIPDDDGHPCWRWAKRRNLLINGMAFPPEIRFYKDNDATVMIVPMLTVTGKAESYHQIAINDDGTKAYVFGKDNLDKITYGRSEHCTVFSIKRESQRVYLCEGVADALAIASRYDDGSVVTPITTLRKFLSDNMMLDYLAKREILIYSDNDVSGTGQEAAEDLALALIARGNEGGLIVNDYFGVQGASDPAHAAELQSSDEKS